MQPTILSPVAEVHDDGLYWRTPPALHIKVPKEARHAGADRWVLFDVAEAELHVFVEANAQRVVQRYYWVQFEAFLPSLPDKRYESINQPVVTLAGKPFHVVARAGASAEPAKSGSDLEHVLRLLVRAQYMLPRELATVRLLHRRADGRAEVMLIYGENLAESGASLAEVVRNGEYLPAWKPIERAVTDRALKRFEVTALR